MIEDKWSRMYFIIVNDSVVGVFYQFIFCGNQNQV